MIQSTGVGDETGFLTYKVTPGVENGVPIEPRCEWKFKFYSRSRNFVGNPGMHPRHGETAPTV